MYVERLDSQVIRQSSHLMKNTFNHDPIAARVPPLHFRGLIFQILGRQDSGGFWKWLYLPTRFKEMCIFVMAVTQ